MTSLHYTDSSYPSSSQYTGHSAMRPPAPSFPPSPSAYVIDPMSPTALFGSQPHSFPSLYTSNFSLPPSAFSEPIDDSSSAMPSLDDDSLLLEPSHIRLPSSVSVTDSCDGSSVSGSQSPLDSPFILLPPTESSASSSLSSSSSSVTSASPPPGKRRRVSPLTKEQRAAINKAKHKEIDANRRQREASVVKQLQRLTRRKHEREEADDSDSQEEKDDASGEEDDVEEGRRDKVTVLEESAATIAQLRALCRRMRRACNAKDQSIRSLQKHLNAIAVAKTHALNTSKTASSLADPTIHDPSADTATSFLSFLPEPTSNYLSQLDRSHALYTSTFVRSPLSLVLIAIPSGVALDVNEVFERSTGWKRRDIVGTLIGPPADGSRPKHPMNPMVLRRRKDGKTALRDGEGEEDGWWGRRYLRQYPSSKLSMKEVWRGETKKVEVVWRVVMADGSIYETMYTIWLADADWVSDGQGGYELRPHQMVFASAYGDAIRVDEWEHEDVMPWYLASCCPKKEDGAEVLPPPPESRWKRKATRGVQIDDTKLAAC